MSENDVQTTPGPAVLGEEEMKAIRELDAQRDSECPWLMRTAEIRWQLERVARDAIIPALNTIDTLTARLRAAEERERAVQLRPEVQAYAEAIQRLLDENQGEKGDGWKHDGLHDLLVAVYRKTGRLWNTVDLALSSGQLKPSVLVAAASVGAHAMFVADVMGALGGAASPQAERVAGDEGETP